MKHTFSTFKRSVFTLNDGGVFLLLSVYWQF